MKTSSSLKSGFEVYHSNEHIGPGILQQNSRVHPSIVKCKAGFRQSETFEQQNATLEAEKQNVHLHSHSGFSILLAVPWSRKYEISEAAVRDRRIQILVLVNYPSRILGFIGRDILWSRRKYPTIVRLLSSCSYYYFSRISV
jgi:hypothetical protein